MNKDDEMVLARCEEARLRVLRGDGTIGIMPVEEVRQMVADYEALVADPDVDVIYVGTPHPMHAHDAILALEAGRYAPSLELAFRIARAFGVGVEDVFHWEEGR